MERSPGKLANLMRALSNSVGVLAALLANKGLLTRRETCLMFGTSSSGKRTTTTLG